MLPRPKIGTKISIDRIGDVWPKSVSYVKSGFGVNCQPHHRCLPEAAVIAISALFILLQIPLGSEFLKTSASETPYLRSLSTLFIQAQAYTYQIGMVTLGIAGLTLCYGLYRAKLVPQFFVAWGFIGYVSFLTGSMLEVLGFNLQLLHTLPGGLWEITIGAWLIIKGFHSGWQPLGFHGSGTQGQATVRPYFCQFCLATRSTQQLTLAGLKTHKLISQKSVNEIDRNDLAIGIPPGIEWPRWTIWTIHKTGGTRNHVSLESFIDIAPHCVGGWKRRVGWISRGHPVVAAFRQAITGR